VSSLRFSMRKSSALTTVEDHSSAIFCGVERSRVSLRSTCFIRTAKICALTRSLIESMNFRRLLASVPKAAPICYADHIEGLGTALFRRACELDLEGIVAKKKFAPHVTDREQSGWFKIRNPHYSQSAGREELFERERHEEPTPGWHTCDLACVGVEE